MKGFQSVRIVFGDVTIETSVLPSANPGSRLECEISVAGSPKMQIFLHGHEVEDFMQCIEALTRLKRKPRGDE